MAAMRVPLWLKIGWTGWVIAWGPFYWTQYGLQNFLFFCDLGNLFLMLALVLESPLIFSWQATGLLLKLRKECFFPPLQVFTTLLAIGGVTRKAQSGRKRRDRL